MVKNQIETLLTLELCADEPDWKKLCGVFSLCSEHVNGHSCWKKSGGTPMVLQSLASGSRWAVVQGLEAVDGCPESLIVSTKHAGDMMPSAVASWGVIDGSVFEAIPGVQFKEMHEMY